MSTDDPLKSNLAPCKHGAKGWPIDWTCPSSCPTTNPSEESGVYIRYIYNFGLKKQNWFQQKLPGQVRFLIIHWRGRSRSQQRLSRRLETFATSNRKDAAPCRLWYAVMSCLQKWLPTTVYIADGSDWKRDFKIQVLGDVVAQGYCVRQVSWFSHPSISKPSCSVVHVSDSVATSRVSSSIMCCSRLKVSLDFMSHG